MSTTTTHRPAAAASPVAVPGITREQVAALLGRYRPRPSTAADVEVWHTALAEFPLGDCEAAMLACGPRTAKAITAIALAARIRDAHTHPTTAAEPAPAAPQARRRDRDAERAHFAVVGRRGITAVDAAMGWQRHPDHDAARAVRCPFCKATPGQTCSPLSRNRAGHREDRSPATGMHPSRVAAAHARTASTSGETR